MQEPDYHLKDLVNHNMDNAIRSYDVAKSIPQPAINSLYYEECLTYLQDTIEQVSQAISHVERRIEEK